MATGSKQEGARVRGKGWLWLSIGLGGAYIAYVLWAKFAKLIGPPPVRLSETGEFLLFLSAIVAFTAQVVVEERGRAPHAETEDHP
jgi:hypothetical protein